MSNEITYLSYLEHLKRQEELSRYLPSDHPKRLALQKDIEEMVEQLNLKK